MATSGASKVPDFASLYRDPVSGLSPRLAARLWAAAGVLSDSYREPGGRDNLVEDLPPLVARVADDAWYDQFVACFDVLEHRLAVGDFDPERLACCTGEEMALHLTVDMAESLIDTGALNNLGWTASLPPWRAEDDDTEWARAALFRDHDVLWLFEASLDGIEAADSDENIHYRPAHIHPATGSTDSTTAPSSPRVHRPDADGRWVQPPKGTPLD